MRWLQWLALALLATALPACTDIAEPAYSRCVQLKLKDDIEGAWSACNEAVGADATSKAGQAATKALAEMKPAYDKLKAGREAQDAKAKAIAAAAPPPKPVLTGVRYPDIDDVCSADGMGRQGYTFSGGTVGDVTATYGCLHMTENAFCCFPSRMR